MPCGACGSEPNRALSKLGRALATKSDLWAIKRQVARAVVPVVSRERNRLTPGVEVKCVTEVDERERQSNGKIELSRVALMQKLMVIV